jgi:hypothetical protein
MDNANKINLFIQIVNATEAHAHVNTMYDIITKYDASETVDRDFAFDCLIQYFTDREEYEKCAVLLKQKNGKPKRRRFLAKEIDPELLADLLFLGYPVSENLVEKILKK